MISNISQILWCLDENFSPLTIESPNQADLPKVTIMLQVRNNLHFNIKSLKGCKVLKMTISTINKLLERVFQISKGR